MESDGLRNLNFEVYGKVQKVYFRKYTEVRACDPVELPCHFHRNIAAFIAMIAGKGKISKFGGLGYEYNEGDGARSGAGADG